MKPPAPRECHPCTACCEGWLKIDVEAARASLGSPCAHCVNGGCNDYANRPVQPCRTFICAWRGDASPLPDWLRPDNCKAIVMFDRLTWRGQPAIVAVAAGARIPPRTLNWLKQYAQDTQRPLLGEEYEKIDGAFTGKKRIVTHGPPDFMQEMAERFRRGENLW